MGKSTYEQISPEELLALVRSARGGDQRAMDRLYRLVEDQVRRFAHWALQGKPAGSILDTNDVSNYAYLKVVRSEFEPKDRAHLLAYFARVVRNIAIDNARHQRSLKQGGDYEHVPLLPGIEIALPAGVLANLALEEALEKLARDHPKAEAVLYAYHVGRISMDELAATYEVKPPTIRRWLIMAEAVLRGELRT